MMCFGKAKIRFKDCEANLYNGLCLMDRFLIKAYCFLYVLKIRSKNKFQLVQMRVGRPNRKYKKISF
jgi:hypothetical protein